jgi:hypothetical protein
MHARTTVATTAAALVAAIAPAAPAAAAPPRLVGTPALTYDIAGSADAGRFVSVGATIRLDRPFVNRTELHRYTVVAAPRLRAGQHLADELFGGTALRRISARRGAWYRAEAVELKQRRSVRRGARWQVALARGNRVVGVVKTVTLRRA